MSTTENQRRSFRLDVEVGFEATLVSEQELRQGITLLKNKPNWNASIENEMSGLDEALRVVLDDLRRTAPKATSAIELVNRKIDLIRADLMRPQQRTDLPLHRINLSATGLAFVYQSPVEKGVPVHCAMLLPSIGWYMEIYARVVFVKKLKEGRYRVALDFEYIREEDSEQLIRFNLQQQQLLLAEE